jgi:hypothetical protein
VQREFQEALNEAGKRHGQAGRNREAWSDSGRPQHYNLYDRIINCDNPAQLRHYYGANVIPLDFLVTGQESIRDCTRTCIGFRARNPGVPAPGGPNFRTSRDLHLKIQVRAGPYIKHFARQTVGAPQFVLQFDGTATTPDT